MVLADPEKSGLIISKIDGLGPVDASVNMTDYATIDGSRFNSARIKTRTINFTLLPIGINVELNRLKVYRFFPVKKQVKIEVKTDSRDAIINGYVEFVTPDIFSDQEEIEVSIVCPTPYFYDVVEREVAWEYATPLFRFPFSNEGTDPVTVMSEVAEDHTISARYNGDYDTGVELKLEFSGSTSDIDIYNVETNLHVKIIASKLPITPANGDVLVIQSYKGNKSAIIRRSGVEYNAINAVDLSKDWMELHPGTNTIIYSATNAVLTVFYRTIYAGV